MTDPHPTWCLHQCPDHHGVNAHTIYCPVYLGRACCDDCRAETVRQEIAADPYYSGNDYGIYGDGE